MSRQRGGPDRGTIWVRYEARCGKCDMDHNALNSRMKADAEHELRADGWAKTTHYGWVCGACYDRIANAYTTPGGRLSR